MDRFTGFLALGLRNRAENEKPHGNTEPGNRFESKSYKLLSSRFLIGFFGKRVPAGQNAGGVVTKFSSKFLSGFPAGFLTGDWPHCRLEPWLGGYPIFLTFCNILE